MITIGKEHQHFLHDCHLPPVATLFSAVLGENPIGHLLAGEGALSSVPAAGRQLLTGRQFFPHLISGPFHTALVYAFVFAIVACLVAAVASFLRGGQYHHVEVTSPALIGLEPVEPESSGIRPVRETG